MVDNHVSGLPPETEHRRVQTIITFIGNKLNTFRARIKAHVGKFHDISAQADTHLMTRLRTLAARVKMGPWSLAVTVILQL